MLISGQSLFSISCGFLGKNFQRLNISMSWFPGDKVGGDAQRPHPQPRSLFSCEMQKGEAAVVSFSPLVT